jgi:phosphatidate cytidylyltransferase
MALNLQTLKTRSLTAVVFVAVMLVGLLWNFWSFLILFSIVHFGCWIEYLKLVEKINNRTTDVFIKQFFAFTGFVLMFVAGQNRVGGDVLLKPIFDYNLKFKWLFWIFLMICLVIFIIQNKQIQPKIKWMMFGGFIYITLPFTALLNIRTSHFFIIENLITLDFGKVLVCTVVLSIWINDTLAYIVGSLIGKTPFSKISPKKTWEGTIGGAILCVVVISLIAHLSNLLSINHAAIIAALCAIFGTMGDLFESKLKRMAGVKDSGSIMPGHGGFLDRFDSLLFAAPVVWVYVKLFM